jgi:hypothetical protein
MLVEPSPRQLEEAFGRRAAGASITEAAGIHPAAEELEAMLVLAQALADLPSQAPAPGSLASVREEFLQIAAGHRAAWVHNHRLPVPRSRHPLPSHGFRWTVVVGIAVFLALVAGVSLALAAQLSEPDSGLYGLKLETERILLAVNRSPTSKASVHLQLASQRFRDTEAMAATGRGDLVVLSMAAYYDELRQAGAELARAQRDAPWKSVRNQFDSAESKPIDSITSQLQNEHLPSVSLRVQALAGRFAEDRKSIDAKLNAPVAGSAGGNPQAQPSGVGPQPAAGPPGPGTPTP